MAFLLNSQDDDYGGAEYVGMQPGKKGMNGWLTWEQACLLFMYDDVRPHLTAQSLSK